LKKGRKPADLFKTLSGIWWILLTGAQWNQLPERYGKWNSVYRFHLRWAKKGIFASMVRKTAIQRNKDLFRIIDGSHVKVHQDACYTLGSSENQCFGKTKGGRNTKLHAMTNEEGKLLDLMLLPGNEHEILSARKLLGEVKDAIVLADRGYDSDVLRKQILDDGGVALIPPKKGRRKPVLYFSHIGKKRHVVENYFCRIKRYRRVATRYDRLSETYLAFVSLASLMD
jgi:transposase